MRRRGHTQSSPDRYWPALSLLGSLILLPACATKPSDVERPAPASATATEHEAPRKTLEVIQLQHAVAGEVATALTDLIHDARGRIDDDAPRAVADPRTNSVIVLGDDEERSHIRDLVARLDTPPQDTAPQPD